ncbi:MAG: hypothetical protein J1E39_00665 [Eubacterium sp.]|nr:hypothetical protein [Eubacterium sp.]
MILHTIVSEGDIFYRQPEVKTVYRRVDGGLLELSGNGNEYVVNRLHSTNPAMYLDKRYYPRTKSEKGGIDI